MDVLQGALEASPDAVLVVDESGVIRRANRNVSTVLGYDPRDLEGRVVEDLLPSTDRERHVQYRREYMTDPEPRPMGRELDLHALHRDGTEVPVEISLGPIEHGGDRYVVVTITDVTRRKDREERLRRQNERLDEFASIVSHDLRSPLNVAVGRVDLAREECDSPHLDAVARAHDRMWTLIDDLLTLAREGETAMDVEPLPLAATVEDCWRNVATARATLVTGTERTVRADRSRLKQLLENLIGNAVEHGGEDVTVTVGDLDDGFYVEDDGSGVPEAERDRVFEGGYSTADGGTGVGLAIVDRVAEAHGWTVRITGGTSGGTRVEVHGVEGD